MSKHTPGPLETAYMNASYEAPAYIAIVDRKREVVAHVFGAEVQAQADAHLFAAAPELLDALRSAITHLEALHERDCYGCNTCNRVLPAFCALVAKAEGETL